MNPTAPLVGMRYRPAGLTIIQNLGMDQELRLVREPENSFDENAIKVMLPVGWDAELPDLWDQAQEEAESLGTPLEASSTHIGYIAREFAKDWAPKLDKGRAEGEIWPKAKLIFSSSGSPMVELEVGELYQAIADEEIGYETQNGD